MSKRKGTRAERELSHMFWQTNSWAVIRSAGSGSTTYPNPDLIASNGKKILAIECKSIKNDKKYLSNEDVEQLRTFSEKFGAEAWFGIRFDGVGWYFLNLKNIEKSKKTGYKIPIDLAKKKGLVFEELIGKYRQKRITNGFKTNLFRKKNGLK